MLASYTFSKVIDTAPWSTSFIPNSAAEDPNLVQDTLQPNADRALGDANVAHRFVFSGVWDIAYADHASNRVIRTLVGGWSLASITTLQSGRWYSARVNVDLNNDGNRFTDRSPGYGRNTIEGPGLQTVDLRVSKNVRLWHEGTELRFIGEAFNLLNHANFASIQQTPYNYAAATHTFTANSTFGRPLSTLDPRILQVAARITF